MQKLLSNLRLVGNCLLTEHKMLTLLSISMRSLFMQEFSPYICMLVRFNMTKAGQPGQYHGTLAHAAQL